MKKNYFSAMAALLFIVAVFSGVKSASVADSAKSLSEDTKIKINENYYFTYNFSKKPSLGTVVLKIQVFDKNKKQVVPFTVLGESGMPSMAGHHDSGLSEFKLNKKNDYLLPVDIVMPGDWEVRIFIKKDAKEIFKGKINFDI